MTALAFRKAVKTDAKLRMALLGPSGAGKTWTALSVATGLDVGSVAVIDTERGSASKYADDFAFDVLELDHFHPDNYIAAIRAAEEAGYGVLVIDSLSHAWAGKGGALEIVDEETARSKSGNKFIAWGKVTPLQNKLMDAILGSRCHVIATMRSKMKHVQGTDERGKAVIEKIGMQPIQRDDVEYEFDVVGDMDQHNTMHIMKSRCSILQGLSIDKPNGDLSRTLAGWLKGVSLEDIVAEEIAAIKALLDGQDEAKKAKGLEWVEDPKNRNLKQLTRFRAKLEHEAAQGVPASMSSYRAELEAEVVALEEGMAPPHRENSRKKHLGCFELRQATDHALSAYVDHLNAKQEATA